MQPLVPLYEEMSILPLKKPPIGLMHAPCHSLGATKCEALLYRTQSFSFQASAVPEGERYTCNCATVIVGLCSVYRLNNSDINKDRDWRRFFSLQPVHVIDAELKL